MPFELIETADAHAQPEGFFSRILNRPRNEKPYLLNPVGYPAAEARVPRITKKSLPDVMHVV